MTACHCGRPESYAACCGPYHRGEATPPTPERLMRSRFARDTGRWAYLGPLAL